MNPLDPIMVSSVSLNVSCAAASPCSNSELRERFNEGIEFELSASPTCEDSSKTCSSGTGGVSVACKRTKKLIKPESMRKNTIHLV